MKTIFRLFYVSIAMLIYGEKFVNVKLEYFFERARQFGAVGSPDKAIEYLNKALKLDPDHFYANAGLALAHSQRKDFRLALLYANKAVQSFTKNVKQSSIEALDSLMVVILEMLGDSNSVKRIIDKIAKYSNNDLGQAYDRVARMYFELGIYDKAEQYCENITKLHPNDADALRKLAWTYFAVEKFQLAEQTLRIALELTNNKKKQHELFSELKKMRRGKGTLLKCDP